VVVGAQTAGLGGETRGTRHKTRDTSRALCEPASGVTNKCSWRGESAVDGVHWQTRNVVWFWDRGAGMVSPVLAFGTGCEGRMISLEMRVRNNLPFNEL
jgi:hypothetical protein